MQQMDSSGDSSITLNCQLLAQNNCCSQHGKQLVPSGNSQCPLPLRTTVISPKLLKKMELVLTRVLSRQVGHSYILRGAKLSLRLIPHRGKETSRLNIAAISMCAMDTQQLRAQGACAAGNLAAWVLSKGAARVPRVLCSVLMPVWTPPVHSLPWGKCPLELKQR